MDGGRVARAQGVPGEEIAAFGEESVGAGGGQPIDFANEGGG